MKIRRFSSAMAALKSSKTEWFPSSVPSFTVTGNKSETSTKAMGEMGHERAGVFAVVV